MTRETFFNRNLSKSQDLYYIPWVVPVTVGKMIKFLVIGIAYSKWKNNPGGDWPDQTPRALDLLGSGANDGASRRRCPKS